MHILIIPSERLLSWDSPLGGIFQMDQAIALRNTNNKVGMLVPAPVTIKNVFKKFGLFFKHFKLGVYASQEHDVQIIRHNSPFLFPARYFKSYYKQKYLRLSEKLWRKYVDNFGMPDIIHVHNAWCAGSFTKVLKEKLGFEGSVILTEHDSSLANLDNSKVIQESYLESYESADIVLTVSSYLKSLVLSNFPQFKGEILILPNILSKHFENLKITDYGFKYSSDKPIRFITIGRLIGIKNHKLLIEAFNLALNKCGNLTLKIVGDGPLYSELINDRNYISCHQKITFTGYLDRNEIIEELRSSDAFVLPSDTETFGVALIEALSLGLPSLAFKGSGPDDIIIENINGYLVENKNAESLADSLLNMAITLQKFDRVKIRENCLDRFSEKRIATQLMSVYQKTIK